MSPNQNLESVKPLPHSENFAHLHLHTVYSMLDGAIRIPDLMKHVKNAGMTSVAITDHGNMYGVIDFYNAAKSEGIKPILGIEAYVSPGSRFDQREIEHVADGRAFHIVLLAKNKTGYKNLLKLSSKAFLEGFYYKPRIDYELLAAHSEGLVGLTACLAGEVNRLLLIQENKRAWELAGKLNEIFGQGNFFLEVQDHGIPEQHEVTKGALQLSKQINIPLVLTNDSHFLTRNDHEAQDTLLRIGMNKKKSDHMEFGFNSEFYVKSPGEMKMIYPELSEAFHNTMLISDMCDVELEFGHPLLPDFETPRGQSLGEYLDEIADTGLKRHFNGNSVPEEYQRQLKHELNVIHSMGFDGYFLIVQDFIAHAKAQGIPVGPGRGSAAGSLVAYSIGITGLDPLKYDLLFERFLNPDRNEMPDIDIDFCRDRREEVIQYVINKYGADHVSQIITFGTLSAKAVVKDVARVLGIDYAVTNAISKNLPNTPGIKLTDAIKESPNAAKFFQLPENKLLLDIALRLEGVPRNPGKHAAGVVISPYPLDEIIPLAKDSKTGAVISQYDKNPLEKIGLVKMDFLGLKNLTIIDNCIKEIERRHGLKIDIESLPLDDPEPYRLLQKGFTKGIFQVESAGLTEMLKSAKPSTFEDIIACIALYRPGPLQSGMVKEYIARKHGHMKIEYPHPSLEPVLKDTFGTLVYQEQIMLISREVGGFSMSKADELRKAMGKKKFAMMAELKEQFVSGALERGYKKELADSLYEDMAKFAEYGFNKSHSAAYALITYQTAYLKAYYLPEFMKASMDAEIDNTDKLMGFIKACRELEIEILPPDINESDVYFTILSERSMRFGLLGIRGLGAPAALEVIRAREEGPFKDLQDFAGRLDGKILNRKFLESLIQGGAFDNFGFSRKALYLCVDQIISAGAKARIDRESGQNALFGAEDDPAPDLMIEPVEEWPEKEKLEYEKSTLGLYLTAHPLDKYAEILPHTNLLPIDEIDDGLSDERRVSIIGIIEAVKMESNNRGHFHVLSLSDLSGSTQIRVYSNLYEQVKHLLIEGHIIVADLRVAIHREGESTKIFATASSIKDENELNEKTQKSLHMFFEVPNAEVLREKITAIKKIIGKYRGQHPVFLHVREAQGKIETMKAHGTFCVQYSSELTREIVNVLGSAKWAAWRVGNRLEVASQVFEL